MADALVGLDDEKWLLLGEGASEEALFEWLVSQPEARGVEIERLSAAWAALYVHGPFAWELLSNVYGPEVIGFPYLSFFRPDRNRICFRAGWTGEFGYLVVAPREELAAVDEQLTRAGAVLDAQRAGLDVVWHCAVENWSFNVHRYHALGHRALGLTPIELQQQARLSPTKRYVGRASIDARSAAGIQARIVGVVSSDELAIDAEIYLDAQKIGVVLDAVRSASLGAHVGTALIERRYSHSGITRYRLGPAAGDPALRTVSPPFLANRSLFINPQRHSYATRDELKLPPVTGFFP